MAILELWRAEQLKDSKTQDFNLGLCIQYTDIVAGELSTQQMCIEITPVLLSLLRLDWEAQKKVGLLLQSVFIQA